MKSKKKGYISGFGHVKPCPFCGEKKMIHLVECTVNKMGMKYYYIECMDCDARTGNCYDKDAEYSGFDNGIQMAKFGWNMRKG